MSLLLAQIIFPNKNGLPEDASINTLHFGTSGPGVDDAQIPLINAAILDFYNAPNAVGTRISDAFALCVNSPATTVKWFRLNDAPPRAPLATLPLVLADSNGASQPGEVALTLSFQAAQVSGVSQARKKNRIFLGPLDNGMISVDVASNATVGLSIRNAALDAMQRLWTASAAAADWSWVTYSPTLGIINGVFPVDNGWVDNAFDTQRRRGLKATVRSTKVFV
jgi:hypothetical protein